MGYVVGCLVALDVVAAVVQIYASGPRAIWWVVAVLGAVIVTLAGRWLVERRGSRRLGAWAALAVGVLAFLLGSLAGFEVILRSPKPSVTITSPQSGSTVGACEQFIGTSTGIPKDHTLVLAVRDRTSGKPETYLWNIAGWDTGDSPDNWSGTVWFNTPDDEYEIRAFMVRINEVKNERADERNGVTWSKPAIPDHWGSNLAGISVVGRPGPGTANCKIQ
ncbi:hypothetical protein ACIA8K_39545 [Catenuloplanes sp. NPDC051500]|uniref:hypothetical protein n=1 Tax=Catenuloplanes sp. NPDC051500 TaxID=3363959 RepID=UPI0037945E8A